MGTQLDGNMAQLGSEGEQQDCFVLKWSEYHLNVADSFKIMRADGDFLDTTVACSGSEQLQAHRVVLSAFSPYLKGMLRNNPAQHPVLIMPANVKFGDLHSLLEFMYHGEVRVPADSLESLMSLAQLLKIKGLTEDKGGLDDEHQIKVDPSEFQESIGQQGVSGSIAQMPSTVNVMRRAETNKGDEPLTKRKRMTSTSTTASEGNDDSRLSHPPLNTSNMPSQATYPQSYQTASDNDFMENTEQIHSGAFDVMQPGGPSGGEAMSGSGIKLTGLLCPQCRIMCHGVNALKEHMAAAHGILNPTSAPVVQTPVKGPKPTNSGNGTPLVNRAWSTPNMQGQGNPETSYEPETFYCKLCPKEKAKPFTSHQKLLSHTKRAHKDDLEEEALQQQAHGDMNTHEEPSTMHSPLPQQDTSMTAPVHRQNPSTTPAQIHKRGGRGGSSRGRSPAVNRPKKGITMARSENMIGGKMEVEKGERIEGRYVESPGHRQQVAHAGDMTDGIPTGNAKLQEHSTVRPVGQVSPAPRNNPNIGVSTLQSIRKQVPNLPGNNIFNHLLNG